MSSGPPYYEQLLQFPNWAAEYPIILNRETMRITPLKMNYAQRCWWEKFMEAVERDNGARMIILKSRKLGFSTLLFALNYYLTIMNEAFHSIIFAQDKDVVKELFDKLLKLIHNGVSLNGGAPKTKHDNLYRLTFVDPQCRGTIRILWASRFDKSRGDTPSLIHYSEASRYPDFGQLRNAATNAMSGKTVFEFVESTAAGLNNEFHSLWVSASEKRNDFVPTFFGYDHDRNCALSAVARPVLDGLSEQESGKIEWTADEQSMRHLHGLSDDQLNWRRSMLRNNYRPHGKEWLFPQEFPLTAAEAFVAVGRQVFSAQAIRHYREHSQLVKRDRHLPDGTEVIVGDFLHVPAGRGVQAKVELEFHRNPDAEGPMHFYRPPDRSHRYVVGIDPASGEQDGHHDYSVIQVFEIVPDGPKRQAAIYRAQIQPYELGCIAVWLGLLYRSADNTPALLVPEVNKDFGCTLPIRDLGYPRRCVYRSVRIDSGTFERTKRIGLYLVGENRAEAFSMFEKYLNGMMLELNDHQTVEEIASLTRQKGKVQASRGCHDDTVMAMVVALYGDHAHRTRDVPVEELEPEGPPLSGKGLMVMAYERERAHMGVSGKESVWN